jgi:hypothetical protein
MEGGRQLYGRILFGIVNLVALTVAIILPIAYGRQDSSQVGQYYIPIAAVLPTTIICASVPVLTAVFCIRWLTRRAKKRRAPASDTPVSPPEILR